MIYDVEGPDLEIDTNSRQETVVEDVIGESQKQRRLADSRVADQQQLE